MLAVGNIMAVQDSNFLMMNKIGFCIKCQTGFPVPQVTVHTTCHANNQNPGAAR
jgi:hypothetical protein